MIEHRRSFTDANEHEYCGPLLWPESRVAFIYKADRASGIERVGIENLLILLATRATGRLITGPCENLDRRTVGTRESGGGGRASKTRRTSRARRTRQTRRTPADRRARRPGGARGAPRAGGDGHAGGGGRAGGGGSAGGRGRPGGGGRRGGAGATAGGGEAGGPGRTRLSLGWWLALPARSQEKDG